MPYPSDLTDDQGGLLEPVCNARADAGSALRPPTLPVLAVDFCFVTTRKVEPGSLLNKTLLLSMRTHVLPQLKRKNQRVRILLRTTVLATTWLICVLAIAQVGGEDEGANIGIGLLMFALLIAAAGVWGAADGARQAYAHVAVTWVAVAVLMGLLVPVFTYLSESGSSWRALIFDVVQGAPFIAVLIIGPALGGGLVGRSISHRSHDDGRG